MKVKVTSPSFSANSKLRDALLKEFPSTEFNIKGIRFDKKSLIDFLSDADGVILGLEEVDKEVLESLNCLKVISKYGVGLNNLDLEACKQQGIKIGWTGGTNKLSVAEMTLGYMLMLSRNLYVTSNQLKAGMWNKSGGSQLSGKTIGIIGLGFTGKELVRLLKPFECEILVNDIVYDDKFCSDNNLCKVSKEDIYKKSDFLTVHTPLDETTFNLLNSSVFKAMKSSAFVFNPSRGGIVNEVDLKDALKNNLISGAAIDAYFEEPPIDKELIGMPNLICTPHIGGNSLEAIESMGMSAIMHLKELLSHEE